MVLNHRHRLPAGQLYELADSTYREDYGQGEALSDSAAPL